VRSKLIYSHACPGKSILKDLEKDVVAINEALTANLQTHVPLIAEVGAISCFPAASASGRCCSS